MRKIGAAVIAMVLGSGCFLTKARRGSGTGTNEGETGFGRHPRTLPPPGQPSERPDD